MKLFKTALIMVLTMQVSLLRAQTDTAKDFFVTYRTKKSPTEVLTAMKSAIEKRGLKIFSEIAHHEEAEKAGEKLPFTHVIIFGNPKVGTKLMQCDQKIGYELPLRIVITESEDGTSIFFRDPGKYVADYHVQDCASVLVRMGVLLREICAEVD